MPGISLAVGADLAGEATRARIARLQAAMQHQPSYKSRGILLTDRVFLGYTKYDAYPLALFESDGYHIVVEGHVYNRSPAEVESQLKDFASRLAGGQRVDAEIASWVAGSDGDYIVLMISLDRDHLLFFNDALGRLPCYVCQHDGMLLLSREVKFLAGLPESIRYDRQGIAETLFFGYPLGERTLIEGVSRLEFGSLLEVNLRTLEVRSTQTYSYNFDECEHAGKPIGKMARELKDIFVASCDHLSATFGERPQVVSLSGGLDSRCVAAGMVLSGARISAASFDDAELVPQNADSAIAEKIAAELGIDWQLSLMAPTTLENIRRLLLMRDGLNYVRMAFIIPFFETLKERFGPDMVYYTGDVGDRLMWDQTAAWRLKSFDSLLKVVLDRNSRLGLDEIETLTGVSRADFADAVGHRLEQYPEKDMDQRYVHFIIAERLGSWNWQAEDRNRCFFWSVTPFSATSFFKYVMNVPPRAKHLCRLYEAFVTELAPQLLPIPNASWHAPFASPRRYVKCIAHGFYSKFPGRVRRAIQDRTFYKRLDRQPYHDVCLAAYKEGGPTVHEYIDLKGVDSLLARRCNRYCLENLLTVTGYIQVNEELRRQVRGGPTPGTLGSPVLEKEQQS